MATFLVFGAITMLPGDPVRALFGFGPVDPEIYARIAERLHLGEPYLVQYGYFVRNLVTMDFGGTLTGVPIRAIVRNAVPASLWIVAGVLVVQAIVAPAMVWVAGMWPGSRADRWGESTAIVVVSAPVIVVAMVLFSVAWAIAPSWSLDDHTRVLVYQRALPILALGMGTAAHLALVAREEVLAMFGMLWARAARGMGLSRGRVLAQHAVVPALGPIIQLLAANLAVLVTGLIVVEGVFGVPGIGGTLLQSIRDSDRLLSATLLTFVLVAVIVVNVVADAVHALIDPRVRGQLD